ncbi:MAG: hypothetical protein NC926_10090, partial [Candidatus Omnitrophica bacterium]|nr:hypothetical protein [Candidatus Omnitrophota bacterium]
MNDGIISVLNTIRSKKRFYLFLIFFLFSASVWSSSNIHLYIFLSPDCPSCELVKPEALNKLAEKIGCKIEAKYFDINQIENYKKLIELEERYKDTDNELPV